MKRTEQKQINTPEYWNNVYNNEHNSGKCRFDDERKHFVYNAIRDVMQYFPYTPDLFFLDAGCGSAELLNLVHAVFPEFLKYGLDFSSDVINYCFKFNPNFEFKCSDVTQTGYPNDYFHVVHCGETLEHVDDPPRVIAELARITMPKGNFIISVPLRDKNPSPEHIWEFTINDIIDLTEPYGELRDIRVVAGGLSIIASTKIRWQ